MKPVDNVIKGIPNEVPLSDNDRATLASYVKQEGFNIIQRLMEDQVNLFAMKLINTDHDKEKEVLANHALSKVAAQLYVGLIDKINSEIELYTKNIHNFKDPEVPNYVQEIL